TFHNGAVKQAPGRWHCHQGADFSAAAGLAEDRDVARISAKCRNVLPYPFQRSHDVQHPNIARVCILLATQLSEIQIAKHIEPMVYGDDHDVVPARQVRSVINYESTGSLGVPSAVQPHHYGPIAFP